MEINRLGQIAPERVRQILDRSRAEIFAAERIAHVRGIIQDVERRRDAALM